MSDSTVSMPGLADGGVFVPTFPTVPSEKNSVLTTPLALTKYPPGADTDYLAYGIDDLTFELFDMALEIWCRMKRSHAAAKLALMASPVMQFNDQEFHRLEVPGRQLILTFYEQEFGVAGLTARSSTQPVHYLGPREWFADVALLPVVGFTNICFLSFKVTQELALQQPAPMDEDGNIIELDDTVDSFPDTTCPMPDFEPFPARQTTSTSIPRKPSKIPRPPNEWIIYRADNHQQIKLAYPDISNNEISSIIAGMWAAETKERKERYKLRAQLLKESHAKAHPGYKYSPRKPAEKKKRVSRKSLAKPVNTENFSESFQNAAQYAGFAPAAHSFTGGVEMDHIGLTPLAQFTTEAQMMENGQLANTRNQARAFAFGPNLASHAAQQQDISSFLYGKQ